MMDEKLFEKMNEDGVVVITSSLNSDNANKIVLTLLNYANTPKKEIQLFISSGSIDYTNVLAIYDVIESLPNPVSSFCIGSTSGCAVLLLIAANKGKRFILKNSEITLNELFDVVGTGVNQQTEIVILSEDISRKENIFESIIAKHTNLSVEEINKLCRQSTTFKAEEAVIYGLVDEILE